MEPYFQVASGVIIIGVALWMIWRTRRNQQLADEHDHHHEHEHSHGHGHSHHGHGHGHGHGQGDDHDRDHHHGHHAHHDEARHIDTGHGRVRLEIFEEGVAPRFRLYAQGERGHVWPAGQVRVETQRSDGSRQLFSFVQRDGFVESEQEIPEPHAFTACLRLGHEPHGHDHDVEFAEHDHAHAAIEAHPQHDVIAVDGGLGVSTDYQDAHERAHANDIRRRFAGREVTTGQIILFGLTGGLIPCPASITVLLLCLQLKKIALGATLVVCFSIGLALTMVASGALAALSVKHVSRRWGGFGEFARKAPYFSGALIALVGLYVGYLGLRALI
jgi:nickel/cobalt exporter